MSMHSHNGSKRSGLPEPRRSRRVCSLASDVVRQAQVTAQGEAPDESARREPVGIQTGGTGNGPDGADIARGGDGKDGASADELRRRLDQGQVRRRRVPISPARASSANAPGAGMR